MSSGLGGRRLLASMAVLLAFASPAAALVGSPPYVRHVPELDVYPQNFTIAQDSRGIVYVGNTDGVLEFDGEVWTLIALDNREIVRSLAVGPEDRVYVGGYNAFGYLQRDDAGAAHFVDLSGRFAQALGGREFADIWQIVVTPEGVYFRALRDLFVWDPVSDAVGHWHHPDRFGAIVHDQGATLVQFRDQGLRRRDGDGGWVALPETGGLDQLVFRMVPLAGGGLLTMGVDGAWRRVEDGRVEPVAMPRGLPASSDFERAITLADGSLVLASRDGVLYLVEPGLERMRHFKIDPGYLSGLHAAVDGGFLVAGDRAIYRVTWPTPWSVLGGEHGADGSLNALVRWGGDLFVLSSAGVLRIVPAGAGLPRFEPMTWADTAIYDMVPVDEHRALLAAPHKLMLVERGTNRELTQEIVYPRMFRHSRFRPGRIYIGTEAGLRYLDIDGDTLRLSPLANEGLDMRVSSLAETGRDELWVGTERHGLWRVQLGADGAIARQQRYGGEQGLQLGVVPAASVAQLADGSVVAGTHAGLFRLHGAGFVPEDLDGLADLRGDGQLLRVAGSPDGELWAYGTGRVLRRPADGEWREEPVQALLRGAIERHLAEDDGRMWFVASQSLLQYRRDGAAARSAAPQVVLREVMQVLPDGTRLPLPLNPTEPLHLPADDFGIRFRFAVPDLAHERNAQYQGRLVPYEQEFSPWSESRGYTYSRLRPRQYRLEVRARDGAGRISAIVPYELVIEPPWYASAWAVAMWVALAVVLLWLLTHMVVQRRTRRLAAVASRLEALVAKRTHDLEDVNQRLRTMAHVDGLTGIANRRRLDEYLAAVWAQASERARPVAALAIDVDHFKRYNDTHGHLAGDQLLRDLVPCLEHCLRRTEDLVARYGGEEFLTVMPGADAPTAMAVAEQMRRGVEAADLGVTISVGVASRAPDGETPEALIQAADEALYAAKRAGRNRVVLAVHDTAPPAR